MFKYFIYEYISLIISLKVDSHLITVLSTPTLFLLIFAGAATENLWDWRDTGKIEKHTYIYLYLYLYGLTCAKTHCFKECDQKSAFCEKGLQRWSIAQNDYAHDEQHLGGQCSGPSRKRAVRYWGAWQGPCSLTICEYNIKSIVIAFSMTWSLKAIEFSFFVWWKKKPFIVDPVINK